MKRDDPEDTTMTRFKTNAAASAAFALAFSAGLAFAAEEQPKPTRETWSFGGMTGTYDKAQLQRGFQVYREVCSNCHALSIPFRTLSQPGGPAFTEDQMRTAMAALQADAQAKAGAKAAKAAEANKAQGVAFLAANKAKAGVVTLPSGLQYQVLKAGSGPVPKLDDTVSCHYRGTLIDGTEFDSSYARKEPASFPVNGVIKGWTEALQKMPVGSKWRLVVPSDLAYGDHGAGAQIGPGAVLVFEVELLAIEPKT